MLFTLILLGSCLLIGMMSLPGTYSSWKAIPAKYNKVQSMTSHFQSSVKTSHKSNMMPNVKGQDWKTDLDQIFVDKDQTSGKQNSKVSKGLNEPITRSKDFGRITDFNSNWKKYKNTSQIRTVRAVITEKAEMPNLPQQRIKKSR